MPLISQEEKNKELYFLEHFIRLILDESTAALDPIAEEEMYLRYAELAGNKTSIFISHHLSNTRFCDCIVLVEDGCIQEIGTHDDLLIKKGKYFEIYELQSYYYKEGRNQNALAYNVLGGEEYMSMIHLEINQLKIDLVILKCEEHKLKAGW